ncbi:MAG: right-handed parallel beta-helix repeat-containing protein [Candidatus Pacebacteria bacterium]|nr:right-handed parallel beta-helix repeat-containing protein [Candidatus Paceibacterota bacterium]
MTRGSSQLLFLFILFSCLFYAGSVRAETVISDTEISTDTTWTKANGPYVISQDTILDSGVTLTLEPGVIVKFDNSLLKVYGTFIAEGTGQDKIYFTSLKDDSFGGDTNADASASQPSVFDRGGISFYEGSDHSRLSNLIFQYLEEPLSFRSTQGEIDQVSIEHSEVAITAFASTILVKNSTIANLDYDGIDGYNASTVTIASTTIDNAGGSGVGVYDGSAFTLTNATIKNLSSGNGIGIYNSSADISNSTFQNIAEDAVGVYDSKLTFKNSSVKDLDFGSGIYASGASVLDISGSVFDGSSDSGVTFYGNSWTGKPSSLTIVDSTFRNFGYAGISAGDIISGSIASSTFEKNFIGLDVWRTPFAIHGNAIKENDFLGLLNESDETTVQAENNWWGDASGPSDFVNDPGNPEGLGDMISGAVDYSPWLTEDPFLPKVPTCCSSVAFLPGIEGSRLYRDNFGGLNTDQLWEPNFYSDVVALDLDANGKSLDPSIYTKDIIDSIPIVGTKIYKSFMDEMDGLKTAGTITDWKALPYDWRLSADDTVNNPVKLADGKTSMMVTEIENLAKTSKTGKVTLIAHSMGGIVSKALIKALEAKGEANLVDKFIMVAVPQVGTPEAVSSLLHGYGEELFHGLLAGAATMRTFGENLSGAYQLLPSAEYFTKVSDPVVTFDPSIDTISNFRQTYGDSISTKAGLQNFLLGADGRAKPSAEDITLPNILNSTILTNVNTLHDGIDSYQIPSNIAVTQIAGWGLDTIKGIKYQTKDVTVCADKGTCQTNKELDMRPTQTEEGDGTVVVPSATEMNTATYYVNLHDYDNNLHRNNKHADILEARPILDFLNNLVRATSTTPDFVTTIAPVPSSDDKRLRLSGHSPISINLYDSSGKHTGLIPIPDSDFNYTEEQIPNSYYFELGDGKYVGFPDDGSTKAKIAGTGIGTFTLEIERVVAGQSVATSTFADIPVLPSTLAMLSASATTTSLIVDLDGNGTVDFTLLPQQDFDPIQYLQVMKNVVNTFTLDKGTKQSLLNKIDTTIKMLQKSKAKGVSKRIAGFLNGIRKDKIKEKKINSVDEQTIINMLNTLLDNLKTQ